MPTPYRVATADDLPALTEVMATAFLPDPVWGPYSFPDAAARPAQSRAFWQANVAATLRFPWTIVTPACEAAAVWVPPGEPEMTPEQERGVALLMAGVLGSEQAEVVMAVFDQLDAAHPHDVDHYYLSLLGTHDDHRGKGLGMGVLAASLDADRRRASARLPRVDQPGQQPALPVGGVCPARHRHPAERPCHHHDVAPGPLARGLLAFAGDVLDERPRGG